MSACLWCVSGQGVTNTGSVGCQTCDPLNNWNAGDSANACNQYDECSAGQGYYVIANVYSCKDCVVTASAGGTTEVAGFNLLGDRNPCTPHAPPCTFVPETTQNGIVTYESQTPSSTLDRVCTVVRVCDPSTHYQSRVPNSSSNAACTALTTCSSGQQFTYV
jgi:hypothetical protein